MTGHCVTRLMVPDILMDYSTVTFEAQKSKIFALFGILHPSSLSLVLQDTSNH